MVHWSRTCKCSTGYMFADVCTLYIIYEQKKNYLIRNSSRLNVYTSKLITLFYLRNRLIHTNITNSIKCKQSKGASTSIIDKRVTGAVLICTASNNTSSKYKTKQQKQWLLSTQFPGRNKELIYCSDERMNPDSNVFLDTLVSLFVD